MSLILATGSNIGNCLDNLKKAKQALSRNYEFIAESRVYKSEPVEYLDQNDFYNQVLEFKTPKSLSSIEVFKQIKKIERDLGRNKIIEKGPRNIDIDIIFWDLESFQNEFLTIPHLSWKKRSFVVLPLKELPFYEIIKKKIDIPDTFESWAKPITKRIEG